MYSHTLSVTTLWLPLILWFSAWSVHAKDGPPWIVPTKFETAPFNLQYFEDSDVILTLEQNGKLWRSSDAGAEWLPVDNVDRITSYWMHPVDHKRAYALGNGGKHWFTKDKGENWEKFELPDEGWGPSQFRIPIAFHATNFEKIIFHAQQCEGFICQERAYYTKNDFDDFKVLRKDVKGCAWGAATPESSSAEDDNDSDRILCIVQGEYGDLLTDNRILYTDNYFKDSREPLMKQGHAIRGFINMANVKSYIIAAAKSEGSSELSMYVSRDGGNTWHMAEFPANHKIEEEAYTVMESTNYSIQVDVLTTSPFGPMGVLFSSNSNGTYFHENIRHTNRNMGGIVDFEKMSGIQGIMVVNVVKNWEEVERNWRFDKQITSKISFDDGRTFKPLKDAKSDKELHLHSVTGMSNTGKIFSSPAPGIAMGVGSTGDSLKSYTESDLWVSDDAGVTWRRALEEAHKYEIGDQGTLLVAIYDEGATDEIKYSLNHGTKWDSVKLPNDHKITAGFLTTVPDSTSQKFILAGSKRGDDGREFIVYSIDFNGIYDRKCEDDDFEKWDARKDDDGKPDCLMGHKQTYRRRKKDAKCYVGEKFKEALPEITDCACTWEDYECDFNFKPEGDGEDKKCIPAVPLKDSSGACKGDKSTFKSSSGFRKIPGNTCTGSVAKFEDEIERPCDQTKGPAPADGKLRMEKFSFPKATGFGQKVYLERSDSAKGTDETIIMSTIAGGSVNAMWKTEDHGKNWEQIEEIDSNAQYIFQHPHENDRVFFLTPNVKKVWYSIDRGLTYHYFEPDLPLSTEVTPIAFHPKKKDSMIWIGSEDCKSATGDCHNVAYVSENRGAQWTLIARYSGRCEFIDKKGSKDLIYCVQHKNEESDGPFQLVAGEDLFRDPETMAEDVLAFATMSEFIVVAQKDPESNLKIRASVDGKTFADALFPHDFNVPHQTAYTLLDSSTHSVFLHVTVGSLRGFEYGRILKSNSNGTSYVLSIDGVNRNSDGYVDFEKMLGLDGVALVNVVDNIDEEETGARKKLRSFITHNDGAGWAPLKAPTEDHEGKAWACDIKNPDECSLHIHSYTERDDPRDTFSSPTAIGMMMGVGNVGKYLGDITGIGEDEPYTFITNDAGVTWKTVMRGRFMWEYGDQGSLIVIVEKKDTMFAYYSTDEGDSWKKFSFAESKVTVLDLTTVPSDNSKQFLLWVRDENSEIATINVDFSSIRDDRICETDHDGGHKGGDFLLWSPKHPLQETDCLFGHTTKYLRKRRDANCWNGSKFERKHGESTNCSCTAQDFECDYNFEPTVDKVCKIVEGFKPLDHKQACFDDPSLKSYFKPEGYRKIPISTCEGGEEKRFLGQEAPCPGHEPDFAKDHPSTGLSGITFFVVVIVLPILAAVGIGYWVWTQYQSGGVGFGRIRLGDASPTGSAFDADRPWVKYPVAVFSGLVAVLATVPLVIGVSWRFIRGSFGGSSRRYTSRQSFARGRGDYAIVDPDEDELLGDDDDEENMR